MEFRGAGRLRTDVGARSRFREGMRRGDAGWMPARASDTRDVTRTSQEAP